MRIIAYVGVAMLLVFFAVPAIDMLQRGEWSKATHALPIFALLVACAVVLWRAGKRERQPQSGWCGESVCACFSLLIWIATMMMLASAGAAIYAAIYNGLQYGEWLRVVKALPLFPLLGAFVLEWLGVVVLKRDGVLILEWESKRERQPQPGKIVSDWYGESFTSYFVNCVMKSRSGGILLVGIALSWLFALLILFYPATAVFGLTTSAFVWFVVSPIVSFAFFVEMKGRNCETDDMNSIFWILVGVVFPFYPFYIIYLF